MRRIVIIWLDQRLGLHCHRLSNWTPANGGLTCYETWRGS